MPSEESVLGKKLSEHTSFFGIKLWVLIIASFLMINLIVFSVCFVFNRRCRIRTSKKSSFCLPLSHVAPNEHQNPYNRCNSSSFDDRWLSGILSGRWSTQTCSGSFAKFHVYTLAELEMITNSFSDENLIGGGDYGIVYRGLLMATVPLAVKKLLQSPVKRHESEDFVMRVDTIADIRHKNIVKLLGYCVEEAERILVFEYVENGDLHEWLHGSTGQPQRLTWRKRMNVIQGVAKGLAYLHEDIEPKIIHRDIKPRNILLDHQWNPKISDVGFGEQSGLTDVPMEKTDVYSFGILIMEIVSGRIPADQCQPQVYLVDWIKSLVVSHKIGDVVDPRLPEFPSVKELKRVILIALRCVDPDVKHRPRMGDVTHMLEPRDLLLNDEIICLSELVSRN